MSGSASGVGVVGYLLAGGLPLLGRRRGWAASRVRCLEVVTADGRRRAVGAPDSDLGWVLRGGGALAIVSSVTIELIELRTVFGGSLFLPADDAPAALRGWRDWAAGLPNATATSLAVIPVPDIDSAPPMLRGRTVISIRLVHDGPAEEGMHRAAELGALGSPIMSTFAEIPWTESDGVHRDPSGPAPSLGTSLALARLSDPVIDAACVMVSSQAPRRVVELRRLGGALAEPTGLPLRHDVEWHAGTVSIIDSDTDVSTAVELDDRLRTVAQPDFLGRLANFLFGDAANPDAVRESYRAADWTRRQAVRSAYDPGDLLLAAAPSPAPDPR